MYENNVAVSAKAAFAHLITSTSTLKYILNVQRNSIYEKKKSGNNPKAHHQKDSYTVYTLPTEHYMQSPPPPTA